MLIISTIISCKKDPIELSSSSVSFDSVSLNNRNLRLQVGSSPLPSPPTFTSPKNIASDNSGRISIKIFSKEAIGIDNILDLEIKDGYVVVDGGAFIDENYNDSRIAFIYESYPLLDVNKWRIRTKTSSTSKEHKVIGYGIGIKIKDIAANDLIKNMQVFHNTKHSVDAKDITAITCHLPTNNNNKYRIIGGGAVSTNPLLISSKSTGMNQWSVVAMKSPTNSQGLISAFAIGIDREFLKKYKLNLYDYEPYNLQGKTGAGYNYLSISNSDARLLNGRLLISFGTSEYYDGTNGNFRRGLVAMCRETNNLNKAFRYSKPYPDGVLFNTRNYSNSIFIYGW